VSDVALSGRQRKHLRGLAHRLEPVVHVGHQGITDAVVTAVSEALLAHELIKVRLHEPEDKHAMANDLAARADAEACGLVGHTVVLYRRHPERPLIALPG